MTSKSDVGDKDCKSSISGKDVQGGSTDTDQANSKPCSFDLPSSELASDTETKTVESIAEKFKLPDAPETPKVIYLVIGRVHVEMVQTLTGKF